MHTSPQRPTAPVWRFADPGDPALPPLAPPHWRAKADRLASPAARALELAAGGLLFALLRPYLPPSTAPETLRVALSPLGKPVLPDFPSLHVSISHTPGLVMAAVAPRPVGCDVEAIRPARLRIAPRVLTPREYAHFLSLPDSPHRPREFFRLWTLKEAYLKAIGTGLRTPPATLEASSLPATHPLPAPPTHAAALSAP